MPASWHDAQLPPTGDGLPQAGVLGPPDAHSDFILTPDIPSSNNEGRYSRGAVYNANGLPGHIPIPIHQFAIGVYNCILSTPLVLEESVLLHRATSSSELSFMARFLAEISISLYLKRSDDRVTLRQT